jgi:hypothetical protein
MGRRSSPDRIYEARRAAVLSRLIQERRLSEQRAEGLVAAWEAEASERGLRRDSAGFWFDADPWLAGQLKTKR